MSPWGVPDSGRPGLALVVLSVVEQRLDAVRAVLGGMDVVEVAARAGVHRSTVHRWVARYLAEGIGGLADRSHRPLSCPAQAAEVVEVAVAEMRRAHLRWGSRRIGLEMLRRPPPWSDETVAVPSERTIDRILIRPGLLRERPGKRPRESFAGNGSSWAGSPSSPAVRSAVPGPGLSFRKLSELDVESRYRRTAHDAALRQVLPSGTTFP